MTNIEITKDGLIEKSTGRKIQSPLDFSCDLVLIEWIDSARPIPQWQHLSDYTPMEPVKCVSVGFLLHDDENIKSLAPNMGDAFNEENIQASGIIHIPACSIVKITKLEETN